MRQFQVLFYMEKMKNINKEILEAPQGNESKLTFIAEKPFNQKSG